MRWQLIVGMFVALVIYVVGGGVVFWFLEAIDHHHDSARRLPLTSSDQVLTVASIQQELTSQLVQQLNISSAQSANTTKGSIEVCMTKDDLLNVINSWTEMRRMKETERHQLRWNLLGSVFFAITVVTTIGYGRLVPTSTPSRIFCCPYAIVGIPLCLVVVVEIGNLLRTLTGYVERRIGFSSTTFGRGQCNERCMGVIRWATLGSLGVLAFILLPSVALMLVQDWSYATAIYYSFISLTTIGFGDYVAGVDCRCVVYRLFVGVWVVFGLAWLAAVVSAVQERLKSVATSIESRLSQPAAITNCEESCAAKIVEDAPALSVIQDDRDAALWYEPPVTAVNTGDDDAMMAIAESTTAAAQNNRCKVDAVWLE